MVDRSWFRYRQSAENINPRGGIDAPVQVGFPTERGAFENMLLDKGLMIENVYNCATVRFSWEDTESLAHHGIACYRVDWKWKPFPDYYANHENELYYVFLDMEQVTIQTLVEQLGMSAYIGKTSHVVPQIVSKFYIHRNEMMGGSTTFKTTPDPIMGTVSLAIGFDRGYEITAIKEK